ncbi:NAD(P)-binding protein [Amniculicola lignicola CBS 123094]|uniref:NAD(P)-binding protein n=1 Tax=Amniculicola lignicola CBS 123094 TaxID=1392246 RepID=A0A6A5W6P4_9PLEO|nr:NAD(P)-binding protein [Amniculicola lignicola CBS 123094]
MVATLPTHQKAIYLNTQTNKLSFTTQAPLPSIPEEHILQVHSTAITNGELTWAPFCNWPTEHVPGYDVSGTILTAVAGSKFAPGDIVYGRVAAGREGTAREYATILPSETALVPARLKGSKRGMQEAASIPMSAHTAWQALFTQGELCTPPSVDTTTGAVIGGQAKGKRVLVLGAAGSVGMMAVQFGRLAGAWVAGTASPGNKGLVGELGADEVIDYTATTVSKWIAGEEERKFDLVFDCVGGRSMLDGWSAVRSDGIYVSVVPGFAEPEGGKPEGVRSKWFVMEASGEELEGIGRFVEKGLVRGCVDSVWRLEEFEDAFAKTKGGHARGKVVFGVAE